MKKTIMLFLLISCIALAEGCSGISAHSRQSVMMTTSETYIPKGYDPDPIKKVVRYRYDRAHFADDVKNDELNRLGWNPYGVDKDTNEYIYRKNY